MKDFKEFMDESNADQWISKNYSEFITYIQSEIIEKPNSFPNLLYNYSGNMYKIYNSLLRIIDGKEEELKNIKKNSDKYYKENLNEIEILIDGIRKEKVCNNIVVYRYTKNSLFKDLYKNNNKIAIEKGFMSTSLLLSSSSIHKLIKDYNYNCLLKIYVPKGTPGVPLIFNNNQTRLKEYEFLFLPNTNMKIIKKTYNFKLRKIEYLCYII